MKVWTDYQNRTYNNDVCKLLIYFLNNYKINNAIDLGCGSGNETVYMIKNGIKVEAIDRQLFESVQLESTDAVTAFFSIPFCNPTNFDKLWDKIYESINLNGYFVGQFLEIEMDGKTMN